jgi:hypothetical protein
MGQAFISAKAAEDGLETWLRVAGWFSNVVNEFLLELVVSLMNWRYIT